MSYARFLDTMNVNPYATMRNFSPKVTDALLNEIIYPEFYHDVAELTKTELI